MNKTLFKANVISISGNTNYAGVKVLNANKIKGNLYFDGTYTHFLYDEKEGDRRDPAREYVVSENYITMDSYQLSASAKSNVIPCTFVSKGRQGRQVAWANTSEIKVKDIISAEANKVTSTYTDVRYEVDAFLVEYATIDMTLANFLVNGNLERVEFSDDFISAPGTLGTAIATAVTLQDYDWDVSSSTSGTVKVVAEADPFFGKLEFDTTATGSRTAIAAWKSASFQGALERSFKVRFSTSNITNSEIKIGWYASANDYCYFNFDTTTHATKTYIASNANGAGVKRDDTGVVMGATTIYEVAVTLKRTTIVFTINGTRVVPVNCTLRDLDTFVPYIYVDNKAAAEQKILSVDRVDIVQYKI